MRERVLRDNKHEFALYYPLISEHQTPSQQLSIVDADLVHRMLQVLRLYVGDEVILFNATVHIRVRIEHVQKKSILSTIISIASHEPLKPLLTVLLPILKREALECAVDALTQLGVTTIALIYCAKGRQMLPEKDLQRLHKIIIAACEQSKQFAVPELHAPISLEQAIQQKPANAPILFFDPTGVATFTIMQQLHNSPTSTIVMVGPEGDLTTQEKDMLRAVDAQFVALTPTILRAEQAVTLAAGLVRCFI